MTIEDSSPKENEAANTGSLFLKAIEVNAKQIMAAKDYAALNRIACEISQMPRDENGKFINELDEKKARILATYFFITYLYESKKVVVGHGNDHYKINDDIATAFKKMGFNYSDPDYRLPDTLSENEYNVRKKIISEISEDIIEASNEKKLHEARKKLAESNKENQEITPSKNEGENLQGGQDEKLVKESEDNLTGKINHEIEAEIRGDIQYRSKSSIVYLKAFDALVSKAQEHNMIPREWHAGTIEPSVEADTRFPGSSNREKNWAAHTVTINNQNYTAIAIALNTSDTDAVNRQMDLMFDKIDPNGNTTILQVLNWKSAKVINYVNLNQDSLSGQLHETRKHLINDPRLANIIEEVKKLKYQTSFDPNTNLLTINRYDPDGQLIATKQAYIVDYHPPDGHGYLVSFDNIASIKSRIGNNFIVHCESGVGRTGQALLSIALWENPAAIEIAKEILSGKLNKEQVNNKSEALINLAFEGLGIRKDRLFIQGAEQIHCAVYSVIIHEIRKEISQKYEDKNLTEYQKEVIAYLSYPDWRPIFSEQNILKRLDKLKENIENGKKSIEQTTHKEKSNQIRSEMSEIIDKLNAKYRQFLDNNPNLTSIDELNQLNELSEEIYKHLFVINEIIHNSDANYKETINIVSKLTEVNNILENGNLSDIKKAVEALQFQKEITREVSLYCEKNSSIPPKHTKDYCENFLKDETVIIGEKLNNFPIDDTKKSKIINFLMVSYYGKYPSLKNSDEKVTLMQATEALTRSGINFLPTDKLEETLLELSKEGNFADFMKYWPIFENKIQELEKFTTSPIDSKYINILQPTFLNYKNKLDEILQSNMPIEDKIKALEATTLESCETVLNDEKFTIRENLNNFSSDDAEKSKIIDFLMVSYYGKYPSLKKSDEKENLIEARETLSGFKIKSLPTDKLEETLLELSREGNFADFVKYWPIFENKIQELKKFTTSPKAPIDGAYINTLTPIFHDYKNKLDEILQSNMPIEDKIKALEATTLESSVMEYEKKLDDILPPSVKKIINDDSENKPYSNPPTNITNRMAKLNTINEYFLGNSKSNKIEESFDKQVLSGEISRPDHARLKNELRNAEFFLANQNMPVNERFAFYTQLNKGSESQINTLKTPRALIDYFIEPFVKSSTDSIQSIIAKAPFNFAAGLARSLAYGMQMMVDGFAAIGNGFSISEKSSNSAMTARVILSAPFKAAATVAESIPLGVEKGIDKFNEYKQDKQSKKTLSIPPKLKIAIVQDEGTLNTANEASAEIFSSCEKENITPTVTRPYCATNMMNSKEHLEAMKTNLIANHPDLIVLIPNPNSTADPLKTYLKEVVKPVVADRYITVVLIGLNHDARVELEKFAQENKINLRIVESIEKVKLHSLRSTVNTALAEKQEFSSKKPPRSSSALAITEMGGPHSFTPTPDIGNISNPSPSHPSIQDNPFPPITSCVENTSTHPHPHNLPPKGTRRGVG